MSERLNGEVIIIDDKPQGLENLRKLLILERFDAVIVSEAHQVLSEENILGAGHHQQIFIISLDLKSEDPFKALSRLQAAYPDARYAFIGTTFDSKQAEDFFAAGVNAFFTKPISADKFICWVTNSDPIAVDVPSMTSDRAAQLLYPLVLFLHPFAGQALYTRHLFAIIVDPSEVLTVRNKLAADRLWRMCHKEK